MSRQGKIFLFLSMLMILLASFQNCGRPLVLMNNELLDSDKSLFDNSTETGNPVFPPSTETGNPINPTQEKLTYTVVREKVFAPHCIQCHGGSQGNQGDIRYDTFEHTIESDLGSLYRHYTQYEEPDDDCSKISNEEMDLVADWINQGANE